MENLKLSVELPVFGGFYNSHWDGESDQDNELSDINNQRESSGLPPITWDMMEFDYKEFQNETSRKVTSVMEDWFIELGIAESLSFDELVSPKEYNFTTDRIFAWAEISEKNIYCIKGYLLFYREEFAEYLEARHKSRSGFTSFYDHSIRKWDEKLDNFADLDHIELCTVFGFILKNETDEQEGDYEDFNLYEQVEGNYLSCSNYAELLTKSLSDDE